MDFTERLVDKFLKEREIDLSLHDEESLALLRKIVRMRIEMQLNNSKIAKLMQEDDLNGKIRRIK